jgi:hypothetical protein
MLRKAFLALSRVSPLAALPLSKKSPTADLSLMPSTPPCPGLAEVTGIYQDGRGPFPIPGLFDSAGRKDHVDSHSS